MRYGNRSIWKIVLSSPLTMVVAAILFVILAKASWNIYQKANVSDTKLSEASVELSKLQDRQVDLSGQISYLSTEKGVETELRTKYRGVKDNESVAVIVDDSHAASTSIEQSSTTTISWWRKVLHAVGL